MNAQIPTVFEGPFGFTIGVHWQYHAWLMFSIWAVLIPAVIVFTRFGKPVPTHHGSMSRPHEFLYWFVIHRHGLFVLSLLSAAGGSIAFVVSLGFIATLHSVLGIATVLLGVAQLASAYQRGTRGGRYAADGALVDEALWGGDHYDMTPRRRWFEAVHKHVGYFTMLMAFGAIVTGLGQFWVAEIAVSLPLLLVAWLACYVVLEGRGHRHDTYESYYGNHPDHPYNQQRLFKPDVASASQRAAR